MSEVRPFNNDIECGIVIVDDGIRMEYSYLKETKELCFSRYNGDEDIPTESFTIFKLPEMKELAKLFGLPEMQKELAVE